MLMRPETDQHMSYAYIPHFPMCSAILCLLRFFLHSRLAASDLYLQCGILQLHNLTALPAWRLFPVLRTHLRCGDFDSPHRHYRSVIWTLTRLPWLGHSPPIATHGLTLRNLPNLLEEVYNRLLARVGRNLSGIEGERPLALTPPRLKRLQRRV